MVEQNNQNIDKRNIKEILNKYPNLEIGLIINNKYRVMDTESNMNIILRVGCISKESSEDPLILIPRESRTNDFSIIEFKDNNIVLDEIDDDEVVDALQLANGALEMILAWDSTTLMEYNDLENRELDCLANLGNSNTLDLSTTNSAQSMLKIIDKELSDEE